MDTGFRKRSCFTNKLKRDVDSKRSHPALVVEHLADDFAHPVVALLADGLLIFNSGKVQLAAALRVERQFAAASTGHVFPDASRRGNIKNSEKAVVNGMNDSSRVAVKRDADDALGRVLGFGDAAALQSKTTSDGKLRIQPIDGLKYRLARPVSHAHGHLTEVFRTDWGLADFPVVQVNLTTTFPGRVRAWGIHRHTVDRLFVASSSFCIVCYDGRPGSPTLGCVNEFVLGERNQGMVMIPTGVWHGWKNVGSNEGTIISMPSQLYDHNGPDRWELPWDSDAAREKIPYRWPVTA